jgi:hypothetical protein
MRRVAITPGRWGRRRRAGPDGTHQDDAIRSDPDQVTVEYLRRIYANNRDWYAVSESKAQILLAANGAFISIAVGTLLGVAGDLPSATRVRLSPATWVFLGLAVACVVSAVICAALCMWSLHGKPSRAQFTRFGIDLDDPSTYRPEALWYFGHLALLQPEGATARLSRASQQDEIDTLSHHVVELSGRVLRKHRYVNAGWAFTASALLALAAAGVSLFLEIMI